MTLVKTYAPEWRVHLDPHTGRRARQFADSPAKDHPFYFCTLSITPARWQVIFPSSPVSACNIYPTDWN